MKESKQRAYGIDIARLTAMFMVVLLHNLGRGGILDWTLDSVSDLAYLGIENYAIVAVNVFALISGYLSAGKPLKARSIFSIWATACFGLRQLDLRDSVLNNSVKPICLNRYFQSPPQNIGT